MAKSDRTGTSTCLGIETSCDETSASVVRRHRDGTGEILSNIILSQIAAHAPYGGVVPELAARAHVEVLDKVIGQALAEADCNWQDLDGIAATAGPGLIGGVLVGLTTAKSIALVHDLPLVAVNHLEGHALTARLTDGLAFPYLLLLVSGGHTQLLAVNGVGDYQRLGTTIDDALGEAFDKTAKLLGLAYPGGPAVEAAAKSGNADAIPLPRPMVGREGCDFSFSGLKTALRQAAEQRAPVTKSDIADLCAGFQAAVLDILCDRTRAAMALFRSQMETSKRHLVVAGGVAANHAIRQALEALCRAEDFVLTAPPVRLCTDNAAMIAWAGLERLEAGLSDPLDAPALARWPLDPDGVRHQPAGTGA
jgi:N6-L-threonylcarbamoyladenine synthase